MNTRTGSAFRTFLQYLGRGATPVDGSNWADVQRAPGLEKKPSVVKDDVYWAEVAAQTALCQPRRLKFSK